MFVAVRTDRVYDMACGNVGREVRAGGHENRTLDRRHLALDHAQVWVRENSVDVIEKANALLFFVQKRWVSLLPQQPEAGTYYTPFGARRTPTIDRDIIFC